jgi:DNA-binding MarR family transcriptional regulator
VSSTGSGGGAGRPARPAAAGSAATASAATGPGATAPGAHTDGYECARAWSALTAAHTRITAQLSAALDRECALTIHDFEILLRVDAAGAAGLRQGELSAAAPLTQPALSRAVARLASRGWVSRTGVAHDRRGILVAICPAGREVLRRAVRVHAATIGELLLSRLSPEEQDVLARALSRVAADQPPDA